MRVLRLLHASLADGGVLLDTQPVGAEALVRGAAGPLGALDMSEWVRTIATIDAGFEVVLAAGLLRLDREERFVVTDAFEDADDLLTTVAGWQQTRVPGDLPGRVRAARPPLTIEQDVRLRVLARLP